MAIVNSIHEDYHLHSINFSDGMNTVDEIVQYAGTRTQLKKILFTDHSDAALVKANIGKRTSRSSMDYRKNFHNDIQVQFGVEGDLLNEAGDCSFTIHGSEPEYKSLSAHIDVYQWDKKYLTQAYINAIERYHDQIGYIAHLCKKWLAQWLDTEKIVKLANQYAIPLEFNTKNFEHGHTDMDKLMFLLNTADQVYVNSDAHVFAELDRSNAFKFLQEQGFIS